MRLTLSPCPAPLGGTVIAPPSKSMAHRALIAAALSNGESRIENISFSNDILATANALRLLGATITTGADFALVNGMGGDFAHVAAHTAVDCGESGSTLRFLIPLFSLANTPVKLGGQGRLLERPQTIYADIFAAQDLFFSHKADGIALDSALHAGEFSLCGDVSSQFISGLLFALPLLSAASEIRIAPPFESRSYVSLTLRALADFGISASFTNENTLSIAGNQHYSPCFYTVEGDYSQGAFFAVLGAIAGGITVSNLRKDCLNGQGDAVILSILAQCGAKMTRVGNAVSFEKSTLIATEIDLADCPDLGPILMVLGLFCEGETVIKNAGRLRIKESDRIAAMQEEAAKMGGVILSNGDTITLRGGALHGSSDLSSHNDHRIAMAMSIAAMAAGVSVNMDGADAVRKSYPDFFDVLKTIGAKVELL